MSASIEDRVVAMSFENSRFEAGVAKSLSTLDKLKAALRFDGAGKGLDDLSSKAGRFSLAGMANGIDSIKSKFGALSVAAIAALSTIVAKATSAGLQFAKSFTVQPLIDGLQEYETNLTSIQTILANTQASGATLRDVNKALLELNHYSDRTIYNFSQMARNIGTFTAAGVDLQTATASIKGIANLAALSGSSSEQASTAMYQLSQAISAGRVSLQDWNSVVNAGMGGTVFQRALAQTAVAMGTLSDSSVKLTGKMRNVSIAGRSFRESITARPGEQSWLTSKVLTNTLQQFTGDLSNARLAAMGFNQAQIRAIQATARTAFNAATQVKTLRGVIDTAREAAGSGWSQTWQLIFGDFGEAKKLFTGLSNAVNGFIGDSADARNKVLKDWKQLGGRTALIDGVKNAFEALGSVVKPIKDAFREIFPAKTGKDLYDLTVRFRDFMASLRIGSETANNLKRTFAGFFAILSIGKQIVTEIFGVIGDLLGMATSGSGGFLEFTGSIGDWLVAVDKALKSGRGLSDVFDTISSVLAVPIKLISTLATAFLSLFDGFSAADSSALSRGLQSIGDGLGPLAALFDTVAAAWSGFVDGLDVGPILDNISNAFRGLGESISSAISSTDFSNVLNVLQVGLLGGIAVMIRRFFKSGLPNIGGGILGGISDSFAQLTGILRAMQTNIQAGTLVRIAVAIGLITASVVALSFIDSRRLSTALTALAIGFAQLLGAMALLNKIVIGPGLVKIPVIAGSMILLAAAIDTLVISVFALSRLSWAELAKGLIGTMALLGVMAVVAGPLARSSAGLISAGVGIIAISVGMRILASAVKALGSLDMSTLAKGIGAVGVALAAIGAASLIFPPGMIVIGVGLVAVAVGIKLLASSIAKLGDMDLRTLGIGIGAVAASLLVIAGAMQLMPPSMVAQAAGLLLVSIALKGIGSAINNFGGMSIEKIAKGIGTLAAALLVLAGGLTLMIGTLPGAAALLVASAAMTVMASALDKLGGMSWGTIIKGLVALAAGMAVMGGAAYLLMPVAPALLAVGVAILAIGAGFALAGAGLLAIAVGISALVVAGPAGIKLLVSSFMTLVQAIPKFVTSLVMGLLSIVQKVAEVAPQFVEAVGKIISNLAQAVIVAAPQLGAAFTALLQAGLRVIRDNFPTLVQTGIGLILALLQGINNNIGQVVTTAASIIVNLINGLSSNLGRITAAGANLIVRFLAGIANGQAKIIAGAVRIITGFVQGIGNSLGRVITAATTVIARFLTGIGNGYARVISAGATMIIKIVQGIGNSAGRVVTAAVTTAGKFINAMVTASLRLIDVGARAVINFVNGVADAINQYAPQLRAAGANLALAVADGFTAGLASKAASMASSVTSAIGGAIGKGKSLLDINSPSKVFMSFGRSAGEGFVMGVASRSREVAEATGSMVRAAISRSKQELPEALKDLGEFIGESFKEGLLGSADDIANAYRTLASKLVEAADRARQIIASEKDKLASELKEKRPDQDAIKEYRKTITENERILKLSVSTHSLLIRRLDDEKDKLRVIARRYKRVTEELRSATDALRAAKEEQDAFFRSIFDSYSRLPDLQFTREIADTEDISTDDNLRSYTERLGLQIDQMNRYRATLDQLRQLGLGDVLYNQLLREGTSGQRFADELLAGGAPAIAQVNSLTGQFGTASRALEDASVALARTPDQLGTYQDALRAQGDAVERYLKTLEALRRLGLDDATYRKLLDQGVSGQEFASQLLAGGKPAVDSINALDARLATAARDLANRSSRNLYQAGVDTAQGLVDGLRARQGRIYRQMVRIARGMIRALRRELGIRSPSKVFAQIGEFSTRGLAKGLKRFGRGPSDAAVSIGNDAMDALRSSMSELSTIMDNDLDANPVITPVLDLSAFERQSRQLGDLSNVVPITAATSYQSASDISAETQQMAEALAAQAGGDTIIQLEQTNNSPRALSETEIYRQTRNLLSQTKEALAGAR